MPRAPLNRGLASVMGRHTWGRSHRARPETFAPRAPATLHRGGVPPTPTSPTWSACPKTGIPREHRDVPRRSEEPLDAHRVWPWRASLSSRTVQAPLALRRDEEREAPTRPWPEARPQTLHHVDTFHSPPRRGASSLHEPRPGAHIRRQRATRAPSLPHRSGEHRVLTEPQPWRAPTSTQDGHGSDSATPPQAGVLTRSSTRASPERPTPTPKRRAALQAAHTQEPSSHTAPRRGKTGGRYVDRRIQTAQPGRAATHPRARRNP